MTISKEANREIHLTSQGRHDLAARARKLSEEIPRLVDLSGSRDRDDSVRTDWQRATFELARITGVLAIARPTAALPDDPQVVELGEIVTIRIDGAELERYRIVHPAEAITRAGRVSSHSPLGQALLGRRVGDEVEVGAPGGTYRCVIVGSARPEPGPTRGS